MTEMEQLGVVKIKSKEEIRRCKCQKYQVLVLAGGCWEFCVFLALFVILPMLS